MSYIGFRSKTTQPIHTKMSPFPQCRNVASILSLLPRMESLRQCCGGVGMSGKFSGSGGRTLASNCPDKLPGGE